MKSGEVREGRDDCARFHPHQILIPDEGGHQRDPQRPSRDPREIAPRSIRGHQRDPQTQSRDPREIAPRSIRGHQRDPQTQSAEHQPSIQPPHEIRVPKHQELVAASGLISAQRCSSVLIRVHQCSSGLIIGSTGLIRAHQGTEAPRTGRVGSSVAHAACTRCTSMWSGTWWPRRIGSSCACIGPPPRWAGGAASRAA